MTEKCQEHLDNAKKNADEYGDNYIILSQYHNGSYSHGRAKTRDAAMAQFQQPWRDEEKFAVFERDGEEWRQIAGEPL